MPTDIIKCTCENVQQDNLHGKGLRVCNQTKAGSWRCTVCGRELYKK